MHWRGFTPDGLTFWHQQSDLPAGVLDPKPIDHPALDGVLVQVEDDGMMVGSGSLRLLPWESVFDLLASPDYRGCRDLLVLPNDAPHVPVLRSFNTLTDRSFSIIVEGWSRPGAVRAANLEVCGAIIKDGATLGMMSRGAWELTAEVSKFQDRPNNERDDMSNRRFWGRIRRSAISAR